MSEYLEDVRMQLSLSSLDRADWWQFRILPEEELPKMVKFAVSFTTLTINAPNHIQYLRRRLKDQYGVRFLRQKIPSISSAFTSPETKVVFNCTGNAAKILSGVEDAKCYPTRGQVVLARAPQVRSNIMRHGKDYETYVIPRPGSNGNVILGGYMQKGVEFVQTRLGNDHSLMRLLVMGPLTHMRPSPFWIAQKH